MVNFNLEIEKICPIKIKEMELNKYRIDDNTKKSIILYNTAIGEMKKGDFCQAIGDLKKSIAYNKDFTDAIKLMGLCYANMNEYKKAEKVFKSLNKYAIYNELVNEYLQTISMKRSRYKISTTAETANNISNNTNREFGVDKGSRKKPVIGLFIVMFVVAGAGMNYFYPESVQEVLTKFRTSIQGVQEKFQAKNKTVDYNEETDKNLDKEEALAEKNTISNVEPESIKKNSNSTQLEADNYKNETVKMLNDAEKSLNAENYEKAAGILVDMKNRNFDDETRIKFNQLRQSLNPNTLWTIYNDGNKLYKENKYREALPKLIIVSEFIPDLKLMPWITYQIGMCYKETNDKASALIYFNKVKDNYPKSQYASYARMKISEIGY